VEPFRKHLGLFLPRIAIREVWGSGQWAGYFESILCGSPSDSLNQSRQKLNLPIVINIDQTLSVQQAHCDGLTDGRAEHHARSQSF